MFCKYFILHVTMVLGLIYCWRLRQMLDNWTNGHISRQHSALTPSLATVSMTFWQMKKRKQTLHHVLLCLLTRSHLEDLSQDQRLCSQNSPSESSVSVFLPTS